ncbi:MAG: hypothetical protein GXP16_06635 [Gammaproteobacteria bacterium]|nr:hypothetical protein [Gammaproteobacteria bacterium]
MQQLQTSALSGSDVNEILTIGYEVERNFEGIASVERALAILETAMQSTSSVFFELDKSANVFVESGSHGVPSSAPKQWMDKYHLQDPFVDAMMENIEHKFPAVSVSSELVRHRDYVKTDFYNLFLKPQSIYHVMVVGLLQKGAPMGLFGFHRPYGAEPFSQYEATKAALLAPALAASIGKVQAEEALRERDWIVETIAQDIPFKGLLILDDKFAVTYANKGARELLELPSSGAIAELQLPLELHSACASLLGEQSQSEYFNIQQLQAKVHLFNAGPSKTTKEPRYAVYLGPTDDAVIVESQLLRHGLTTREIEVVQLVVAGMTNPEVATHLSISPRTVQNHLRSIYAKVGVHNRTSLLYRLVSND